jgi:hypothetical protein
MAGDKGEGPGVQAKQKSLRPASIPFGHNRLDSGSEALSSNRNPSNTPRAACSRPAFSGRGYHNMALQSHRHFDRYEPYGVIHYS